MNKISYVNGSNFETKVLKSKTLVLVDFTATWCGPCKLQLPILEKFAEANPDTIKVVKVDIDDSPELASKFGIRSVPSLLLFKDGQKVESKLGTTSLVSLNELLDKHSV